MYGPEPFIAAKDSPCAPVSASSEMLQTVALPREALLIFRKYPFS